jgi:hypothetical protein
MRFGQKGRESVQQILRPHRDACIEPLNGQQPAERAPIGPRRSKLRRLRGAHCEICDHPHAPDLAGRIGQHNVTWRGEPHIVIEPTSRAAGLGHRRPEIAASPLLAGCLLMIDPPISHVPPATSRLIRGVPAVHRAGEGWPRALGRVLAGGLAKDPQAASRNSVYRPHSTSIASAFAGSSWTGRRRAAKPRRLRDGARAGVLGSLIASRQLWAGDHVRLPDGLSAQ